MLKKILLTLTLLTVLAALAAAAAVRQLPNLASRALHQALGREVTIGSVRFEPPFTVVMNRLLIFENEPFEKETALYVERAAAAVDPWVLWREQRFRLSRTYLLRPKLIFRKTLGKVHHAFRTSGPAASASGDLRTDAGAGGPVSAIPPMRFDHIHIEDGEVQWMDYDVDRKGFVTSLLRITADVRDAAIPPEDGALTFDLQAYLDQGRDLAPGRLEMSGRWRSAALEGDLRASLQGVQLTAFEPYYRMITPSRIADGEVDIVATAESPGGILSAHSKWTVRRLSFDRTEPGDTLLGYDANVIQSVLAGDDGVLDLDVVIDMDLRRRTVPLREALLQSIRKSVKATFLSNFDSALRSTVDKIADQGAELLKDQNLKDLGKKRKLRDIVKDVLKPT